jgi:hypothetical protein
MPPNRPAPRKGSKFLDAKIFIVTLALAITIGFWNLFSNNAIQSAQSASGAAAAESGAPPADVAAGGPPLPTLVPLVNVSVSAADQSSAASSPQVSGNSAPLRAVAVPTQQIIQKHNPLISQPVQASSSGGDNGGGGGGGQPAPVAQTRSSK